MFGTFRCGIHRDPRASACKYNVGGGCGGQNMTYFNANVIFLLICSLSCWIFALLICLQLSLLFACIKSKLFDHCLIGFYTFIHRFTCKHIYAYEKRHTHTQTRGHTTVYKTNYQFVILLPFSVCKCNSFFEIQKKKNEWLK